MTEDCWLTSLGVQDCQHNEGYEASSGFVWEQERWREEKKREEKRREEKRRVYHKALSSKGGFSRCMCAPGFVSLLKQGNEKRELKGKGKESRRREERKGKREDFFWNKASLVFNRPHGV